MHWYRTTLKPIVDYFIALLALFIFWPILLVIFIVNKLVFSSALFVQERIGKHNRVFKCIKFRTFLIDGEEESIPVWGRFLRYSSLDETPQIINVLRGEMSLIGPRPLLPEYLNEYTPEQLKRHQVKPGITGLAQVKGRNKISWTQSLAYDSYYAEHISLLLDFKILLKTVPQLFKFGQVQESSNKSREPFQKKTSE